MTCSTGELDVENPGNDALVVSTISLLSVAIIPRLLLILTLLECIRFCKKNVTVSLSWAHARNKTKGTTFALELRYFMKFVNLVTRRILSSGATSTVWPATRMLAASDVTMVLGQNQNLVLLSRYLPP